MPLRTAFPVLLAAFGAFACSASDGREWLKVDQKYTTQEFVRDHKACSRDGNPDEACMRARGWVPVNPSKTDAAPPPDPVPRARGRY